MLPLCHVPRSLRNSNNTNSNNNVQAMGLFQMSEGTATAQEGLVEDKFQCHLPEKQPQGPRRAGEKALTPPPAASPNLQQQAACTTPPRPKKKRDQAGPDASQDGFDKEALREAAHKRWLRVPEIIHLLTPEVTPLPLLLEPPKTAPISGSLLLYDRTQTRYFRDDHLVWIKKANGKTIREDHVKLRLKGKNRVSGLYAHGGHPNSNMHRRLYHLVKLNQEEGDEKRGKNTEKTNGQNSESNGGQKSKRGAPSRDRDERHNNLVLVHYLDVKEAAVACRYGPAYKRKQKNDATNADSASESNACIPTKLPQNGVRSVGNTDISEPSLGPKRDDVFYDVPQQPSPKYQQDQEHFFDASSDRVASPQPVQRDAGTTTRNEEVANELEPLLRPRQLLPEITSMEPSNATIEPFASTAQKDVTLVLSGPLTSQYQMGGCLQCFAAFVDVIRVDNTDSGNMQGSPLTIRNVALAPLQAVVAPDGTSSGHLQTCPVPRLNPQGIQAGTTRTNGHQNCHHRAVVLVSVSTEAPLPLPSMQDMEDIVGRVLKARCDEALVGFAGSGFAASSSSFRPIFFEPEDPAMTDVTVNADGVSARVQVLSQFGRQFCQFSLQKDPHVPGSLTTGASESNDISQGGYVADAMGYLSSWLVAPRFDESDAKVERETLSFNEMAEALQDIHGVRSSSTPLAVPASISPVNYDGHQSQRPKRQGIMVSEPQLMMFWTTIESLPSERKAALLRALELCPAEVSPVHQSMFIATTKSSDPTVAAEKYCRHWEMREKIFGADKAFLPMTLDGALADDIPALAEIDYCRYLPGVEDTFGRALLYSNGHRYFPSRHDRGSVLRAVWYMYDAATRSLANPSDGVVFVINMGQKGMANMDKQLLDNIYKMMTVFPMIVRAHHYLNVPWFHNLLYPVVRQFMGREMRYRDLFHKGSNEELIHSLAPYGMLPNHLPVEIGGKHDVDVASWLQERKRQGL